MSNKEAEAGHGLRASRFLGSLKDALAAASRDDTGQAKAPPPPLPAVVPPPLPTPAAAIPMPAPDTPANPAVAPAPSAAEAAREVKGQTSLKGAERHVEFDAPPTTRVVRAAKPAGGDASPARTQILRGRQQVSRGAFSADPVVAWLVVVGGPGLGNFRPVFEGNNTIGRAATQRVPLDFGDEAISHEEQAYIRYDSAERSFLFVPNLAKTNVVSVNNKRPTTAVELTAMDVVTMGRTQLVFVPFCGQEFDWSEIAEARD